MIAIVIQLNLAEVNWDVKEGNLSWLDHFVQRVNQPDH